MIELCSRRTTRWLLAGAAALALIAFMTPPAQAATFTVMNTDNDGAGSLRQAILDANANSGLDTIVFAIPGAGPHTIQLTGGLPQVTQPVVIDGYTQDGAVENTAAQGSNAELMIELDGTNAGATARGFIIPSGGAGSTIRGLAMNRFGSYGIHIATGGGVTVGGNFIGTDVDGAVALGNARGVFAAGAPDNVIGGTDPAARNVISGNTGDGVRITGPAATGNIVAGNLIGTDAAGTTAVPNADGGVSIDGAPNNTLGGTAPGAGNVISGNGGRGVLVGGASATGNVLMGNLIGTSAAGDAALGNSSLGVDLQASDNMVGGTAVGAGNVISGNGVDGVRITFGASANLLQGNLIGTNAAGTAALANGFTGVRVGSAPGNVIGGSDPGAGNVISGNTHTGVTISGASSSGNVVAGNLIGTDAAGDAALPNNTNGVQISDAAENTIGGPAGGNVIAGNVERGIAVFGADAVGNSILGNAIFDNGGLGIDLGGDGVTANDPLDADAGPNNLQNYPVLTEAAVGSTTVEGTLHSAPNATFRVEFFASAVCDPSGHGQGRDFLGAVEVTTDGDGDAAFAETLAVTAGVPYATATATRLVGGAPTDTSEFSPCVEIEGVEPPPPPPPEGACPPDEVPPSGFTDVAGNIHETAIDCVAWHGIALGVTAEEYGPGLAVRRDQMASFIARMLETAGHVFPPASDQGFGDIAGNVHAERINQLAEAGIVQGVAATSYAPSQPVRRDQMASFLVRAYELVAGALPPPPPSGFTDTAGNVHEANIDKAAAAEFALGTTPTTYAPAVAVRRDQMASFLTRVLERLAAEGFLG